MLDFVSLFWFPMRFLQGFINHFQHSLPGHANHDAAQKIRQKNNMQQLLQKLYKNTTQQKNEKQTPTKSAVLEKNMKKLKLNTKKNKQNQPCKAGEMGALALGAGGHLEGRRRRFCDSAGAP